MQDGWIISHPDLILNGQPAGSANCAGRIIKISPVTKTIPTSASRSANWTPVGPDVLPPSPDPEMQHGMGRINTIAFHPTDPNTFCRCCARRFMENDQ
ncbi:MAG: hypothetical protein R3B93_22435 [Bacteroidia bacterium]